MMVDPRAKSALIPRQEGRAGEETLPHETIVVVVGLSSGVTVVRFAQLKAILLENLPTRDHHDVVEVLVLAGTSRSLRDG
jgi:hypothetical protein